MVGASPRVLLSVFLVMALLFAVTALLTGAYREERRQRALQQFQVGREASRQGRYAEAIHAYRSALTLSRNDAEYRLALASALIESERSQEAQRHLLEITATDPANAMANVMLARIAAEQRSAQAANYYRRAIYGLWPEESANNRTQARFELVDLLLKGGALKQAQAELLHISDEIPDDPVLKKRVARLFLDAAAPVSAAELYRDVLRKQSLDADAYAGLGQAQFQLGDYSAAKMAFRAAIRWNPHDARSRARLDQLEQILQLDPTARALSLHQRYLRSRQILQLTGVALEKCLASQKPPVPVFAQQSLETGRAKLQQGGFAGEATVESNIAVAHQLNAARMVVCGEHNSSQEPLDLVLEKLSR